MGRKYKVGRQVKAAPKPESSVREKLIGNLLGVVFAVGILLPSFFMTRLYQSTVIHWQLVTGIWCGVGVIALIPIRKYLFKYFDRAGILVTLGLSMIVFGGLFSCALLAANIYLPSLGNSTTINAEIIDAGQSSGRYTDQVTSYVDFVVDGCEKRMYFPQMARISGYHSIRFNVRSGALGFDIIDKSSAILE